MHDLDRTSFEVNDEAYPYGQFEFESELPGGTYGRPFSEAELDELAMELLQVRDEQELDQFLGSLLSKAARAVGKFVRSPAGEALKGILKKAVSAAVPVLSAAVPGLGALGLLSAGSDAGTAVGAAIKGELEWEGGPGDNRELEAAKKVIEVGGTAAQQVATMPPNAPPQAAVEAVQSAAQQQGISADGGSASGGVSQPGPSGGMADTSSASGTWYRRGRTIVVVGL
jgi:hypothetical protein